MIKQECIGIPDMILLLMIFCFKKIKIKAEIVLSPRGAYFHKELQCYSPRLNWIVSSAKIVECSDIVDCWYYLD